ncbi:AEC family transporter [Oryzicola mucosus]|uniref:AEC family transporter n=1 Tax=Oryzicola mucosus TaxID=2767425 RepID=A0A8J6U110_9HYPH|nr:AEC family transporter [Oryzicola mucosus]MBD0416426.1 AEC family transporter [Oryzicola mucosus]
MSEIVGLVLPFFGMIFAGFVAARITRQPIDALGWMNTFILYVALPALFFQLLSKTPFEQLTEWRYIAGAVIASYSMFLIMFVGSMLVQRSGIAESTMRAFGACYGNIGYMGPGIALLALGEEAAVPVALIFCVENALHFCVAPTMMALAGDDRRPPLQLAAEVVRKILLHPFIVASLFGVAAAYFQFRAPLPIERLLDYFARAAAPCALFAMGVTLALRPLKRVPREIGPILLLKLILQPLLCYVVLSWIGNFSPIWMFSAIVLAALPTATNVFVIAQQYNVWVERASATILISTCVSVVTLSGLLYMIMHGMLIPDLFP